MMVLIGTFAYEFQVVLPVLADQTFHGGPTAYGFMLASMGVGAVAGGLVTAARATRAPAGDAGGVRFRGRAALSPPGLPACSSNTWRWPPSDGPASRSSPGGTRPCSWARPSMRGRVMALWAIAFQGTTPIGGPLIV